MAVKEDHNSKFPVNIIIIGLVVIVVLASFFIGALWTKVRYLEKNSPTPNSPREDDILDARIPSPQPPALEPLQKPTSDEHIRGNPDANVTLIEYSDFDCPYCASFHETAKEAVDLYGDDLMWVYRHFPLDAIHQDARKKAEASECIAELGGNDVFWQFSDKIIKDNTPFEEFSDTVQSFGIKVSEFDKCMLENRYSQKVSDQANSGSAAGVTGTPGNFIMKIDTGEVIILQGAVSLETLKQSIDPFLE